MSKSRAFLLEPVAYNLASLEREFNVVHLFENSRPGLFSGELPSSISDRLDKFAFDENKDLVIATGDFAAVTLLTAICGMRSSHLKLLIFDSRLQGYRINEIDYETDICTDAGSV